MLLQIQDTNYVYQALLTNVFFCFFLCIQILIIFYKMRSKKIRVKSQVYQVRNISPWVSKPQQSNRNELQAFLNKNQLVQDVEIPKHVWTKTKTISHPIRPQEITAQPNNKIFYKTFTGFSKPSHCSFNRKFYSRSTFLQKEKINKQRQQLSQDKIIFAKKYKISHKPKLVKVEVGNINLDPNLSKISQTDSVIKPNQQNSSIFRARIQKKKIMLKKNSFTKNLIKDEILGHKKFINSLQNCLGDIQRVSYNAQSNKLLCKTLKDFLTLCKRI